MRAVIPLLFVGAIISGAATAQEVFEPALALGGWMAFKPAHGGAMVMGDLVLLESEINPVMAKLIEGGIEITAVHNHLLRANPATFYMHVGGRGDAAKMQALFTTHCLQARPPCLRRPQPLLHQPLISIRRT